MKIIILSLCCLLAISSFCQTSEEYYNHGLKKTELKDYEGAIKDFTKAIDLTKFETDDNVRKEILDHFEIKKKVAEYFWKRGNAKWQIQDFGGAEKDYWNLSMLLPDFPEGHFLQGKSYFELQEYSLAIHKFNEALELDSSDAEAYYRRGLAKYQLASPWTQKNEFLDDTTTHKGNYFSAIADFTKALEIHCCPSEALFYRGKAKGFQNDNVGAMADFTQIIEHDVPQTNWGAASYQERGLCKLNIQDYHGAMQDLNKAINISPDSRSYRARGAVKLILQDFRGAISDCTESIKLDPQFPTAYMTRGIAEIELKQFESACIDFSKAGELGFTDAYDAIKKYCNK